MERVYLYILACFILVVSSGCVSSLKKKFIRGVKSKELPVVAPTVEESIDKRVFYERHFVFVKVWMDELIDSMEDENTKRQKRSKEELIQNLRILRDYIGDSFKDKKKWLDNCIEKINQICVQLNRYRLAGMPMTSLKLKVEELRREFHIKFLPDRQSQQFWEELRVK